MNLQPPAYSFQPTVCNTILRDRDGIYDKYFKQELKDMEIEDKPIAPHVPWQNPCVERLIGSVRRECLDHVIVLGENHLRRILTSYFDYDHLSRTHLCLDRNARFPRDAELPEKGEVIAIPQVGRLHHRYTRAA